MGRRSRAAPAARLLPPLCVYISLAHLMAAAGGIRAVSPLSNPAPRCPTHPRSRPGPQPATPAPPSPTPLLQDKCRKQGITDYPPTPDRLPWFDLLSHPAAWHLDQSFVAGASIDQLVQLGRMVGRGGGGVCGVREKCVWCAMFGRGGMHSCGTQLAWTGGRRGGQPAGGALTCSKNTPCCPSCQHPTAT